MLKFEGGSIFGAYTITGQNTGIEAGLAKIFNTNVTIAGTWNVPEAYPEWFGSKGDYVTDDIIPLQKCVSFCENKEITIVLSGSYVISDTLNISTVKLQGNRSVIKYTGNGIAISLSGNKYNLMLENFVLVTETGTYGIKGDDHFNRSILRNIKVQGFSDTGIYMTKAYLCNLENIRIEGCGTGLYLTEGYCSKLRNIDSVRNNVNVEIGGLDISFDSGDISFAGQYGIKIDEMSGCSFKNIYFETSADKNNVSVFKANDNLNLKDIHFESIYIGCDGVTGMKVFDFSSTSYNIGHVFQGIKTNANDDTVIFALSSQSIQYPRSFGITLLNTIVKQNDKGVDYSGNGYINLCAIGEYKSGTPIIQLEVVNGVATVIPKKADILIGTNNTCYVEHFATFGDGTAHGIYNHLKTKKGFVNVTTNKGTAKYFVNGGTNTETDLPSLITTDNPSLFNGTDVRWSYSGNNWIFVIPASFTSSDLIDIETVNV